MSDKSREQQNFQMDNLIKNSYEFKGIYRNLFQEKLSLEKELELLSKQYNLALIHERDLLKEITELKTSASTNLETTIKHFSNLEDANKKLAEEMRQLQRNVPSITNAMQHVQEKEFQLETLKLIISQNEEKYRMEVTEIKKKCEERVQEEIEKSTKEINNMDSKLKELHEEMEKMKSRQEDDLIRITFECNEEVIKLKEEHSKQIKSLTKISSSSRMEILRQKLLHLQSEYSSEVTALQMTIASYRLQMQLCPNCSKTAVYRHEMDNYEAQNQKKTTYI